MLQNGSAWSAPTDATFDVALGSVRITELNYDPPTPARAGRHRQRRLGVRRAEKLRHAAVNLQDIAFTDGINYTFGNVTLAPGQVGVLVHNTAAFTAAATATTSNIDILGDYQSTGESFSNSGERSRWSTPSGQTTRRLHLQPRLVPRPPHGSGPTLEVVNPASQPRPEPGEPVGGPAASPTARPAWTTPLPTAAPTGLDGQLPATGRSRSPGTPSPAPPATTSTAAPARRRVGHADRHRVDQPCLCQPGPDRRPDLLLLCDGGRSGGRERSVERDLCHSAIVDRHRAAGLHAG